VLFVGMGSPAQEYFLAEHLEEIAVPFSLGVGGSFDHVAGHVRRAPPWMQRAGLEWLDRLLREPRRLWRRYLIGNARFAMLLLRERTGR
jgi:N-acetylglucosaminyldiphosphoundecaprenol N-acetyl-beta-D-mannosaminyltransferase